MLTGSICSCSVKEIHLYLSLSLYSCILSQLRLRNSGTCWQIWLPPRVPAADLANLPSSSVTLIVEGGGGGDLFRGHFAGSPSCFLFESPHMLAFP